MSINSAWFLLFLLIGALVYYLSPKKQRWIVLLAASGVFYLLYSLEAAVYLLATIAMSYGAARWMESMHGAERAALSGPEADKAAIKRLWKFRRRRVLAAALIINFATLAVFKYFDHWLGTVNGLFALDFRPLDLLLPLGISFYIFQSSGYLIDVYRGKHPAEKNPAKYALFVAYFPQMVQGPINRFEALQPQLIEGNDFDFGNIRRGIELMLWGMLKKVFIADPLALAVAGVYAKYWDYSGTTIIWAVTLYCLQLYCDFSGGTDLVRGASKLFGVELAENFRRPYLSKSIDEFWRRWHISLGEWMKDYLFYPLALSGPASRLSRKARKRFGGKKTKLLVPSLATLVVFLMVGIWQGPGLSNIAYGLWNGGIISASMLLAGTFRSWREKLGIDGEKWWYKLFCILRTCGLVVIGRYFSNAGSLRQALGMLWRSVSHLSLGSLGSAFTCFGLGVWDYAGIFAAAAALLAVSILQEKGVDIPAELDNRPGMQFALTFISVGLLMVFAYLNSDYTAIMYIYENV